MLRGISVRVPVLAALTVVAAAVAIGAPGQEAPPPEVTTATVDLTEPAQPVGPGWTGEADVDPELVGAEWQGDPDAAFTIETRDEAGAWVPAGAVDAQPRDEGPDDGSANAAGLPALNVSEPLWVGEGVTGVRVRLDQGIVTDVDLHTVDSPPAGVPEGSAVVGGSPVVAGRGTGPAIRLAAAGALVAFALAFALARSSRPSAAHGRRRVVGAMVVAALGLAACVPPPPASPPSTGVPAPETLISRTGWGANENLRKANCPGGPTYMAAVRFAVVHHTVNSNSYSASQGPQLVRGIYGYHTQSLGYCDIAYNFLVDRFGNVYEGRYGGTKSAVMGAHARGFNTSSTGVALIGDFRTAAPPAPRSEWATRSSRVPRHQASSRTRVHLQ